MKNIPDDLIGLTEDEVIKRFEESELNELRQRRNELLKQTDWMALSDVTMTPEQIAYRQALRDITKTFSKIDGVEFPTPPTGE